MKKAVLNEVSTPSFILKEKVFLNNIQNICQHKSYVDFTLLYSIKSLSQARMLRDIQSHVDGFSVSSVFEARLARLHTSKNVHYISPAIKQEELREISELCNRVTLNSIEQFELLSDHIQKSQSDTSVGLRINPEASFVNDKRYDPCAKYSKLGIPIKDLRDYLKNNGACLNKIDGFHFHNNSESNNLKELEKTLKKIKKHLTPFLGRIKWLNLGGGYMFCAKSKNSKKLFKFILDFKQEFDLEIILEPGSSISKTGVVLVTSVVDIIKRNNKNIAILDTSINHLPEVLEYTYSPDAQNHNARYKNKYILAGKTCLTGDIFGEKYKFKNKLKINDKIIFENVGNYSLVKAHMFNGVNLPSIYYLDKNEILTKIKEFTFADYMNLQNEQTINNKSHAKTLPKENTIL